MSSQDHPEMSAGKSDVMALVHQLKAGTMSKDAVLQQLRRIQQEKRAASISVDASPLESRIEPFGGSTTSDIGEDIKHTRPSKDTSHTVIVGSNSHDALGSVVPGEIRSSKTETRTWVDEEAFLLAEEEEVPLK